MIADYDPTLSLGEQMRRMSFAQWLATLGAVFDSLHHFCCRVASLQAMIIENLDRVERLRQSRSSSSAAATATTSTTAAAAMATNLDESAVQAESAAFSTSSGAFPAPMSFASLDLLAAAAVDDDYDERAPAAAAVEAASQAPPPPPTTNDETSDGVELANNTADGGDGDAIDDARDTSSNATTTAASASSQPPRGAATSSSAVHAFLSLSCRTLAQLRPIIHYLVDHAIWSVEERIAKRLTTRYRVGFFGRAHFCVTLAYRHSILGQILGALLARAFHAIRRARARVRRAMSATRSSRVGALVGRSRSRGVDAAAFAAHRHRSNANRHLRRALS